jgi:hypothetical protein
LGTLVTSTDVTWCFTQLPQVGQSLETAAQLLKLDETGNGIGPDKGKRENVVCSKLALVAPHFHEKSDVTHVSLVATVLVSGRWRKLLLVTNSPVRYCDSELALIRDKFETLQAAKGYIPIPPMKCSIEKILERYCRHVGPETADSEVSISIIDDNCTCHGVSEVLSEMESGNIRTIWLVSHSTHFLEV